MSNKKKKSTTKSTNKSTTKSTKQQTTLKKADTSSTLSKQSLSLGPYYLTDSEASLIKDIYSTSNGKTYGVWTNPSKAAVNWGSGAYDIRTGKKIEGNVDKLYVVKENGRWRCANPGKHGADLKNLFQIYDKGEITQENPEGEVIDLATQAIAPEVTVFPEGTSEDFKREYFRKRLEELEEALRNAPFRVYSAYDPYNPMNKFIADYLARQDLNRMNGNIIQRGWKSTWNAGDFLGALIPAHLISPTNLIGAIGQTVRNDGSFGDGALSWLSGRNKGLFDLSDSMENWYNQNQTLGNLANAGTDVITLWGAGKALSIPKWFGVSRAGAYNAGVKGVNTAMRAISPGTYVSELAQRGIQVPFTPYRIATSPGMARALGRGADATLGAAITAQGLKTFTDDPNLETGANLVLTSMPMWGPGKAAWGMGKNYFNTAIRPNIGIGVYETPNGRVFGGRLGNYAGGFNLEPAMSANRIGIANINTPSFPITGGRIVLPDYVPEESILAALSKAKGNRARIKIGGRHGTFNTNDYDKDTGLLTVKFGKDTKTFTTRPPEAPDYELLDDGTFIGNYEGYNVMNDAGELNAPQISSAGYGYVRIGNTVHNIDAPEILGMRVSYIGNDGKIRVGNFGKIKDTYKADYGYFTSPDSEPLFEVGEYISDGNKIYRVFGYGDEGQHIVREISPTGEIGTEDIPLSGNLNGFEVIEAPSAPAATSGVVPGSYVKNGNTVLRIDKVGDNGVWEGTAVEGENVGVGGQMVYPSNLEYYQVLENYAPPGELQSDYVITGVNTGATDDAALVDSPYARGLNFVTNDGRVVTTTGARAKEGFVAVEGPDGPEFVPLNSLRPASSFAGDVTPNNNDFRKGFQRVSSQFIDEIDYKGKTYKVRHRNGMATLKDDFTGDSITLTDSELLDADAAGELTNPKYNFIKHWWTNKPNNVDRIFGGILLNTEGYPTFFNRGRMSAYDVANWFDVRKPWYQRKAPWFGITSPITVPLAGWGGYKIGKKLYNFFTADDDDNKTESKYVTDPLTGEVMLKTKADSIKAEYLKELNALNKVDITDARDNSFDEDVDSAAVIDKTTGTTPLNLDTQSAIVNSEIVTRSDGYWYYKDNPNIIYPPLLGTLLSTIEQ